MTRWCCIRCGYTYDEYEGDSNNGVRPGTKFENLPEKWVCPVCGVVKGVFEKKDDTQYPL